KEDKISWSNLPFVELKSDESNYFQGFNERVLLRIAKEKNLHISFLCKQATWLIKGIVFVKVYSKEIISEECQKEIISATDFFNGQPIDRNADYGFNQLAEVAIKALSPGINDPGTAVISLHALSDMLAYKLYQNLPSIRSDDAGTGRIYIPCSSFNETFEKAIPPIWNYGREDKYIQTELIEMISQLKTADHKNWYTEEFNKFLNRIQNEILTDNKPC
ncbi:MAG: DUF2254 family protein, partial [Ginsengibacter sp.]